MTKPVLNQDFRHKDPVLGYNLPKGYGSNYGIIFIYSPRQTFPKIRWSKCTVLRPDRRCLDSKTMHTLKYDDHLANICLRSRTPDCLTEAVSTTLAVQLHCTEVVSQTISGDMLVLQSQRSVYYRGRLYSQRMTNGRITNLRWNSKSRTAI